MKSLKKTEQEKEVIIAEYLLGGITYRDLEKKHGIDFRIIHSWVTKYTGKTMRHQKKPKNQEPTIFRSTLYNDILRQPPIYFLIVAPQQSSFPLSSVMQK